MESEEYSSSSSSSDSEEEAYATPDSSFESDDDRIASGAREGGGGGREGLTVLSLGSTTSSSSNKQKPVKNTSSSSTLSTVTAVTSSTTRGDTNKEKKEEEEEEDNIIIPNSSTATKDHLVDIADSKTTTKPKEKKDEVEVEFIVKNLDTGVIFSSKEIDKYIPKVDPIVKFIRKNSNNTDALEARRKGSGKGEDTTTPKKSSSLRRQRWLAKLTRKKAASEGSVSSTVKKEHKDKTLFAQILRQQLNEHFGSIWVMKFNFDGMLMASGGDDKILRVWTVAENDPSGTFFLPEVIALEGHKDSILAIAWSNSRRNLLLSGSLDKTVRLWVTKTRECDKVFEHPEVVTAVEMHPMDEDLFITGCLDNKLRVWSIRDGKPVRLVSVDCGFMTSIAFTLDGSRILTGSHDGQCSFFDTAGLKLEHRGVIKEHRQKVGKIITGFSMHPNGKQVLITTNDSRIRLYDMKDHHIICSFKGFKNKHFSQIYATVSEKGTFILSGSEDHHVYLWETAFKPKKSSKPPKISYHDSFKAHGSTTTVAVLAPFSRRKTKMIEGQIIVTADVTGEIKVFENKAMNRDKISSSV